MKTYDFRAIEKKWQEVWQKDKRFETKDHVPGKENAYILIEFPYPSGKGLHIGHMRSYTALDALARRLRLQGKNVLFPMGIDAFGLEAERTAIREHIPPQQVVARNTATFREQLARVGLSVDWSRFITTCDPEYYKWTQWQFLQFYKHGMAYKGTANVNYCPNCGILANEEVENGTCCQCHAETTQKTIPQWMMKMTAYADRLIDDLAETDYLPHIKTSQINYVGRSYGTEVDFQIKQGGAIKIFTTCIETIFGCTFVVLAPEHPLIETLKSQIQNWDEVQKYRKTAAHKSEFERSQMTKDKNGCVLAGITAINPVNGHEVPVYIADFVLSNYGTGAVMAVPTHDQRDYEFATKHHIPMIQVIEGKLDGAALEKDVYLTANSKLMNSGEFTGQTVQDAKKNIADWLIQKGVARLTKNYKMHDWVFARQRYWGEPIPIIHCPHCGMVPVPEKDLPVLLPTTQNYEATKDGQSPLAKITDWVNVKCPQCGGDAQRETDTMPGWAGSCWYFIRYCDPHNDKCFADPEKMKAWLPITLYNGGNEHTTRHLLYARFWTKFLYDQGLFPVNEFCKARISQGIILGEGGVKMSKSLGNTVDPRDVADQYGTDALRLWVLFIGDYQEVAVWSNDGVKACHRLLQRVWALQDKVVEGKGFSPALNYIFNYSIQKVTADMEAMKYNTAVSQIMILMNAIEKQGTINRHEYETLLTLLNPFAPHITEELWPEIKNTTWPAVDTKALIQDTVEIVVQVNAKIIARLEINTADDEATVVAKCRAKVNLPAAIKKTIYVKNKLINFIVAK